MRGEPTYPLHTAMYLMWSEHRIPAVFYHYLLALLPRLSKKDQNAAMAREVQLMKSGNHPYIKIANYIEARDKALHSIRANIGAVRGQSLHARRPQNIEFDFELGRSPSLSQSAYSIKHQDPDNPISSSQSGLAHRASLSELVNHIYMYRLMTIQSVLEIGAWQDFLVSLGCDEPVIKFHYNREDYFETLTKSVQNILRDYADIFEQNIFLIMRKEHKEGDNGLLYREMNRDVSEGLNMKVYECLKVLSRHLEGARKVAESKAVKLSMIKYRNAARAKLDTIGSEKYETKKAQILQKQEAIISIKKLIYSRDHRMPSNSQPKSKSPYALKQSLNKSPSGHRLSLPVPQPRLIASRPPNTEQKQSRIRRNMSESLAYKSGSSQLVPKRSTVYLQAVEEGPQSARVHILPRKLQQAKRAITFEDRKKLKQIEEMSTVAFSFEPPNQKARQQSTAIEEPQKEALPAAKAPIEQVPSKPLTFNLQQNLKPSQLLKYFQSATFRGISFPEIQDLITKLSPALHDLTFLLLFSEQRPIVWMALRFTDKDIRTMGKSVTIVALRQVMKHGCQLMGVADAFQAKMRAEGYGIIRDDSGTNLYRQSVLCLQNVVDIVSRPLVTIKYRVAESASPEQVKKLIQKYPLLSKCRLLKYYSYSKLSKYHAECTGQHSAPHPDQHYCRIAYNFFQACKVSIDGASYVRVRADKIFRVKHGVYRVRSYASDNDLVMALKVSDILTMEDQEYESDGEEELVREQLTKHKYLACKFGKYMKRYGLKGDEATLMTEYIATATDMLEVKSIGLVYREIEGEVLMIPQPHFMAIVTRAQDQQTKILSIFEIP